MSKKKDLVVPMKEGVINLSKVWYSLKLNKEFSVVHVFVSKSTGNIKLVFQMIWWLISTNLKLKMVRLI